MVFFHHEKTQPVPQGAGFFWYSEDISMRKNGARLFFLYALLWFFVSLCPVEAAYTTSAGRVLKDGTPVQLKGVVWWGPDLYNAYISDGLHFMPRTTLYTKIQEAGLNAVRIPFCPETLKNRTLRSGLIVANTDLQGKGSLDALDIMLGELNARQIYVVLAHNRPDCAVNNDISESWTTPTYSETQWIADLKFVADRYKNLAYFVGIDLKNEPHGRVTGNVLDINVTWGKNDVYTDWDLAAQRAGLAVLTSNPNILIFVEGIGENPICSSGGAHWWGGNFEPFACKPLGTSSIPANKLVLSPHVYGPDMFPQFSYFNTTDFPNNMPAVWDKHFGYLVAQGYTIIPAGWGGKYGNGGDPKDVLLQDKLVAYFRQKGICSSFFWSLNPQDPQTGGLLKDGWAELWPNKTTLLKNYFTNCTTNPPSITVSPSISPIVTPSPTGTQGCALKPKGDADCNNRIDLIDFEVWRKEFMGTLTSKSTDFNASGAVDLVDFEAWRKGYFGI